LPDGAQAIYQATRTGMAVLRIQGEPRCAQDAPPCRAPMTGANVLVVVE
jgi:hypothetical protein